MKVIRILTSAMLAVVTASNVINSSAQEIQEAAPACTPPPAGLVSWWQAEGTATDSMGTDSGLMTNGATFATGKVGQAFNFNGVNQFVKVPQSSVINSFSNQLTIEFWMKADSSNSMTSFQGLVATDHYGVEISNGLGGAVGLNFYADTGNGSFLISSANGGGITVSAGVWHHVAGVYNGNKLQLFIDGQPAGNSVNASGIITSMLGTSYLSIGSDDGRTYCGCSGRYFWGLIDEPSLYNRALATNEIQAIFNAGAAGKCTPTVTTSCTPSPADLVAWWPGQGNGNDIVGGNNATLPPGGITFSTAKVGTGFNFDGNTNLVVISNTASLNFGAGQDFSIEAWIQPQHAPNNSPPDEMIIVYKRYAPNAYQYIGYTLYLANNGQLFFLMGDAPLSIGGLIVNAGPDLRDGQFHHVAVTLQRSSATGGHLYVDGTNVLTFDPTSQSGSLSNSEPFLIGSQSTPGYRTPFKGVIDEVSLYNRALATSEIQAIYNAGSLGKCFTPSLPVITQQPTNQAIMVGLPAIFSVVASGSAPISYQWQFNGNPIAGATNSVYAIAATQANQAGAYRVVVANPVGATNSIPAVLTVLPLPTVPVITDFTPKSGSNLIFVTVIGSNFSPTAVSNIVYFGAVRAVVSAATKTNLIVSVPVGATYAPITVTVGGLTAAATKPFLPTFLTGGTFGTNSLGGLFNLTTGSGPAREVIGDLDGDGKPDLVAANVYDGTIQVYRNISSGGTLSAASFAAPITFTIGGGTDSLFGLALADLDGDGRLDIITANRILNIVSVFQNLSSPGSLTTNSFGLRTDFKITGAPSSVAVADLNGDGRPEIITANQTSNTISILRNLANTGTITTNSFILATNLATGSGPFWVTIADLDGDGRPDLITANYNLASSMVSTLRNLSTSGNIAFAPKVDFTGLGNGGSAATSDLDGDGKLDVIVGSESGGQAVSVYQNISQVGDILLAPSVNFSTGGWANTVAISDLDGDGKPDMVAAVQLPSHLSVFRNLSTPGSLTAGSFGARVDFASGWNPNGIAIGDLNGDGRPDVSFGNAYDGNISIYQNQVPFAGPPVITLQPTNQTVILGDNTSFKVTATGPQPFTYQWNFNGSTIAGATNNPLILTDAQLSQAGNYSVMVFNALGSAQSSNATLTVTVPVCTIAPAGLVSWWTGNNTPTDSVYTNHGILGNGVTFDSGKVRNGFGFATNSAGVRIPASPALDVGTGSGLTIECWVKTLNLTADPLVEWKNTNSSTLGAHFWTGGFAGAGTLYANLVDINGVYHVLQSAGGVIQSNVWQHVAVSYDHNTGIARLYCNGVIVQQQNMGAFTPRTSTDLYLGKRPAPGQDVNNHVGGLDEVSIYNRALATNEIQAIYAARGAGKCPLQPTVLNVTPPSWYVNEGATVAYTVTAVGSPMLTYQWQFGGFDIAGATNTTLTFSNVVYAQAGNYAVVVSNPGGMTASSNVVLRVNRAPIADASATDTLAISPNGTNAVVVLDGSHSSDPDGDPLTYAWFNFGDTNVFATTVVAITPLPIGTNQITLTVNDGMAAGSQTIAIEVITTSQALDRLIALVQSGSGNTRPLIASLRAALAAIDRSQPAVAVNQLEAFIHKVQSQLAPSDPVLAAQLIADAQAIIDALNSGTSIAVASVEITSLTPDQHGKSHLKIKGIKGRVHVIESSTNMVDWVPVGVANQADDGSFEFDDSAVQNSGARFYRVVSPK